MKKILPLTLSIFLSACKSNQRIIEDAMQSIGSQSQFINTSPEPAMSTGMAFAWVAFGLLFIVVLVALVWSLYSHKKTLEEVRKRPSRRVKKVYMPLPNPNNNPNSPTTYTPTQAYPNYEQPPWRVS